MFEFFFGLVCLNNKWGKLKKVPFFFSHSTIDHVSVWPSALLVRTSEINH